MDLHLRMELIANTIPLDKVPTLEEFQKIYENSVNFINKEIENNG